MCAENYFPEEINVITVISSCCLCYNLKVFKSLTVIFCLNFKRGFGPGNDRGDTHIPLLLRNPIPVREAFALKFSWSLGKKCLG